MHCHIMALRCLIEQQDGVRILEEVMFGCNITVYVRRASFLYVKCTKTTCPLRLCDYHLFSGALSKIIIV